MTELILTLAATFVPAPPAVAQSDAPMELWQKLLAGSFVVLVLVALLCAVTILALWTFDEIREHLTKRKEQAQ